MVALTLPGLLRLLATAPLAALVPSASIVSWGLCLGAGCRNSRPFEVVLLAAVYACVQGATLFDLGVSAPVTMLWHGLALLPAWLALAWAWPRMARR